VRDKHLAGTPDGFECFQNGFVPTADGIDRGDIRPVLQNINGLVPNCGVNAVGIGRFDQFAAGRELPERRPEADFALFFATKSAAAEGQQHGPGAAAHRAAVRYGVQGLDQFGRPRLFPEIEPRSDERGRSGVCMTMSMMKVRPFTRSWLRCRSRSVIACATVAAVLARTPDRLLSTRSTVASLKPDCRAISRIG